MEDGKAVQPENPVVIVEEKETKTKAAAWIERHIPFNRMIWVFFVMNMLNYTERVVVSGSSMKMLEFIRESVSSHENTYLGALTSIFIGGFSIASIVFGYLVTKHPPFRVVSWALICWLLAALCSGLAPNYWVLLFARLVSGVGEAAFQIVVPAYVNDCAPLERVGSSMAILYSAISVGTAVGFMGSGYVSQHYSWRYMYLGVAPLMFPLILITYFIPYEKKNKEESQLSVIRSSLGLFKDPVFIFSFLAEASGVFICAAYMAFGNQLLIHLGLFQDESTSSLVFGAISVIAGLLGSILGGATLNRMKIDSSFSVAKKLLYYAYHFGACALCCLLTFIVTAFTVRSRVAFLGAFFFAFTFVFASNPTWSLVILHTATPLLRPMALGVATICYHILGDVPAPIAVGRVLDFFLKRAGKDKVRVWYAYLYTHWFTLCQCCCMVLWCGLIVLFVKRRFSREKESLIVEENAELAQCRVC